MMHCEIRDLAKTFHRDGRDVPVLDGISIDIHSGKFVVLVGPSGCGKTTILRIIAGLEQASAGTVFINGTPAVDGPRADLGMVTQNYSLFPWLTVRQNIAFGLKLRAPSWSNELDHSVSVEDILRMVDLTDFADAFPDSLSGGMKQRVALARSLVLQPKLLLLDEPLAALDSPTRLVLQEEIAKLTAAFATTVCLVTHDPEEAVYLADTIYLLSARPARVREVIVNSFVGPRDSLLRSTPEFLSRKERLLSLIRVEGAVRSDGKNE